MPKIYAEWICRNCKRIHRVKFPIFVATKLYYDMKKPHFEKGEVKIVDPMQELMTLGKRKTPKSHGSKYGVYVDHFTPICSMIEALREMIEKYYTTEKDTLKVDICFDEE